LKYISCSLQLLDPRGGIGLQAGLRQRAKQQYPAWKMAFLIVKEKVPGDLANNFCLDDFDKSFV
jgi:hypothetical protein